MWSEDSGCRRWPVILLLGDDLVAVDGVYDVNLPIETPAFAVATRFRLQLRWSNCEADCELHSTAEVAACVAQVGVLADLVQMYQGPGLEGVWDVQFVQP